MKLQELEKYNPITIQCHDNPDADAIASGFGLFCYFQSKGKDVSLIYSGRNIIKKSNLVLMLEKLNIPVEYVAPGDAPMYRPGLLITVDCQYGAGNVTKIEADTIAIIDHHQIEIDDVELSNIQPGLGTALYYGLYTDTSQLGELHNPLDRDARDFIPFDQAWITMFRNSNISMEELRIAGVAMLEYRYHEEYRFAVARTKPCDPNILGVISDFLLQVDKIDYCVVFNETEDGCKISVRSCVSEVNAGELASFLTEGVGSGGGHYEKAGGFVSRKKFEQTCGGSVFEEYFMERLEQYHEGFELIYAKDYEADLLEMKAYEKVKLPVGYVKAEEVFPVGTPVLVRTIEGDMELVVEENLYIMIGIKGEVYPIWKEKFQRSYEVLERAYCFEEDVLENEYVPTLRNRETGEVKLITAYAGCCVPAGRVCVYAKPMTKGAKVFTAWNKGRYMLGKEGDYLAVRSDDLHDVYVIEKKIFGKTYKECEEGQMA